MTSRGGTFLGPLSISVKDSTLPHFQREIHTHLAVGLRLTRIEWYGVSGGYPVFERSDFFAACRDTATTPGEAK